MKKSLITYSFGVIALMASGLTLAAQATPIQGTIDFDGAATLNGPIGSATGFTSILGTTGPSSNPTVIDGDQTLDYSTVPGGTAATFTPFAFDGSQTVPFTLWTFLVGSTTYDFIINSIDQSQTVQTSKGLLITGAGTAQITGFSDTSGIWTITDTTANPNTVHVTFSSSVNVDAVPEPASGGIILIGLGALVCFQRLKQRFFI
jgi:hypothetical protein